LYFLVIVLFLTGSRFRLLKAVNVTRAKDLTPKAHRLYAIATNLRRTARRLEYNNVKNKVRIQKAMDFATSEDFARGKVNVTSLNFINSQLRLQLKKSRGRRFTMEDKIFALSLLKHSPRAYKLLEKTFALPSRKKLMALLNEVPFLDVVSTKKIWSLFTKPSGKRKPWTATVAWRLMRCH
jgi:hypothetical protein